MSVAASVHELEAPPTGAGVSNRIEEELEAVEKLTKFPPTAPPTGPIIAIDLDDVLSQTNLAVAQCEHEGAPFRETVNSSLSKGTTKSTELT